MNINRKKNCLLLINILFLFFIDCIDIYHVNSYTNITRDIPIKQNVRIYLVCDLRIIRTESRYNTKRRLMRPLSKVGIAITVADSPTTIIRSKSKNKTRLWKFHVVFVLEDT